MSAYGDVQPQLKARALRRDNWKQEVDDRLVEIYPTPQATSDGDARISDCRFSLGKSDFPLKSIEGIQKSDFPLKSAGENPKIGRGESKN